MVPDEEIGSAVMIGAMNTVSARSMCHTEKEKASVTGEDRAQEITHVAPNGKDVVIKGGGESLRKKLNDQAQQRSFSRTLTPRK